MAAFLRLGCFLLSFFGFPLGGCGYKLFIRIGWEEYEGKMGLKRGEGCERNLMHVTKRE